MRRNTASDGEPTTPRAILSLVEASPEPMVVVSPDRVVVEINSPALALFGAQRSEIVGTRLTSRVVNPVAVDLAWETARSEGSVSGVAVGLRHASGAVVPVMGNATAFTDADGAVAGFVVVYHDVTDVVESRRELSDQRDRLQLVLGASRLGLWDWNIQTDEAVVDARFAEILGYPLQDLMPSSNALWVRLTHPDDVDLEEELTQRHFAGLDEYYDMDNRMLHAHGHYVWVRDRGRIVEWDSDGAPLRMSGTIEDITESRANARRLAEAEGLLRVVLDNSPDPTLRFGADLAIEYVNHGLVEASGIPAEEWVGRTFLDLAYPDDLGARWMEHARRVIDTREAQQFEFSTPSVWGVRWAEASLAPELAADGSVAHVVATIRDVTRRHHAEEELLKQATHDGLTGLSNRAVLADELDRALLSAGRSNTVVAVLMIDLDRFKNVNDSLGHAAGDDLLRIAARRLEKAVRAGDLLARMGGDEFVVVMRDLFDPDEAVLVASRIVTAFREGFTVDRQQVYATASVGVAVAASTRSPEDLLREADTAMYVAKADGRDRVEVFNEDLRADASARLVIESDMRQGVERGEFEVWYQPEVDLRTGRVVAAEALLRWRHHSGEVRTAEHFTGIAEDTGLILALGEQVLSDACHAAATWNADRAGTPVVIRVNVSARQLAEPGLVASIDRALAAAGLAAGLLCIEITETALLPSSVPVREAIEAIHDRGVGIALDDFGTGYASLAYLRQYPIDILKIDRSFVLSLSSPQVDSRLVAGILALAREMDLDVTAEGVEQPVQAARLLELGCPTAQGFWFSEAVPAADFPALLTRQFDMIGEVGMRK